MSRTTAKEPITEEMYRALECIVGPSFVTTEPDECQAYTGRGCWMELYWLSDISRRPAGVILPGTAVEVARIIKVCNQYDIPYLPGSTFGWMPLSGSNLRDDFLVIDLKRINHLEIDDKNMYAVIGPGVIYAHLQAEAMKKDLYTMLPSGGGSVGVIANQLTLGVGSLCYRITASSMRRMNGVEWVSPEGEIVRMGSLVNGNDSGYWRGGPGPGLLGMLKGYSSWTGSMGIVTSMALKLYPFQPERLEPEGIGGDSAVKLPPRMLWHNITFPTEEALQKTMRELGKAQIAAYVNRVSAYWRDIAKCRGTAEYRRLFQESWGKVTPETVAAMHVVRVLLIGYTSPEQLDYEERVLADIVEENGGTLRRTRQTDESCFLYANAPDVWVMTGNWALITVGTESLRCALKMGDDFHKRWTEGYLNDAMDQHREIPWYMPLDFARAAYAETDTYADSQKLDPERPEFDEGILRRQLQFFESVMPSIEATTGWPSFFSTYTNCSYTSDATRFNTPVWVDRFQKEFNPMGLSNTGFPYFGDKHAAIMPEIITDEVRDKVKEVQQARWRGL